MRKSVRRVAWWVWEVWRRVVRVDKGVASGDDGGGGDGCSLSLLLSFVICWLVMPSSLMMLVSSSRTMVDDLRGGLEL